MRKSSKNANGITLIALVITSIIVLIMAAVAISAFTGQEGLFSKTNEAGTLFNEKSREEAEIVSDLIKVAENIMSVEDENTVYELESNSLLEALPKINKTALYKVKVNGKEYSLNAIVLNKNINLDGNKTYTGSSLIDGTGEIEKIYEFGNSETDVATASSDAQNMVVLKVNGNLSIGEKVMLTACKSADGYGGPKGFLVYCTGELTNNGVISMTARGARAAGEDVYLWKNEDGEYEKVPEKGGDGGTYVTKINSGKPGTDGEKRGTGGGGSGASRVSNSARSGKGAQGTSYSGGSGGGGVQQSSTGPSSGGDAIGNGGAGGYGSGATSSGNVYASGGAGNPKGRSTLLSSGSATGNTENTSAQNGTGGLLIMYANSVNNTGRIESNGSDVHDTRVIYCKATGGASGGGSINIFTKQMNGKDKVIAEGGKTSISGSSYQAAGGAGGKGTVNIGDISSGSYMPLTN